MLFRSEADIVHQYERVKDSLGEVEGASITIPLQIMVSFMNMIELEICYFNLEAEKMAVIA